MAETIISKSEVEHVARQSTGADSAKVFHQREISYGEKTDWLVLSVRSNGTSTIIGRRQTWAELLDLAKRGRLESRS